MSLIIPIVIVNPAEMKMILRKKSTKNISIEVKGSLSLQWSENEILLFQCQVFLICQDGKRKKFVVELYFEDLMAKWQSIPDL